MKGTKACFKCLRMQEMTSIHSKFFGSPRRLPHYAWSSARAKCAKVSLQSVFLKLGSTVLVVNYGQLCSKLTRPNLNQTWLKFIWHKKISVFQVTSLKNFGYFFSFFFFGKKYHLCILKCISYCINYIFQKT